MLITHTNTIELDNNQPQHYFLNSGEHYSAEKTKNNNKTKKKIIDCTISIIKVEKLYNMYLTTYKA